MRPLVATALLLLACAHPAAALGAVASATDAQGFRVGEEVPLQGTPLAEHAPEGVDAPVSRVMVATAPHHRAGPVEVRLGERGALDTHRPGSLRGAVLVHLDDADLPLSQALPGGLRASFDASHLYGRVPEARTARLEADLGHGTGPVERHLSVLPRADVPSASAGAPSLLSMATAAPRPSGAEAMAARAPAAAASVEDAPWVLLAQGAGAALLVLAPWALYHRLRGRSVLEQETRSRVFDRVRAEPGISPTEAARALSLDITTVQYHLRRLVAGGFVTTEGPARQQRYFAAGSVPADLRARFVASREGADVLRALHGTGGLSKSELAMRLAIARPTLAWHLGRLERAGLVASVRDGRHVRVRLVEDALAALRAYLKEPSAGQPEGF